MVPRRRVFTGLLGVICALSFRTREEKVVYQKPINNDPWRRQGKRKGQPRR